MSIESPTRKRRQTFKIVDGKIAMTLAKNHAVKPTVDSEKSKKLADARQANIQAMDLLLQSFPAAFDLRNRRPLKTGVKDELNIWAADNNVSKKCAFRRIALLH
ncbi:hypothetical protein [Piscirickettsia litoralis]|uniref:hypothetical protein n=1 Tax=Piscirickettsia litoralis TaxID=1891921 RepID=UPI001F2FC96C|nr:hypothetical protein [Piscirickettsia litoralis]